MTIPRARRGATWAAYGAAWLPFAVIYTMLRAAEQRTSLVAALPGSIASVSVAALLGVAVWHVTGVVEGRARHPALAVPTHVVLAGAYALLWIGSIALRIRWQAGGAAAGRFLASPATGWQLFSGMWLYGVIAGISRLARLQRRDAVQREALAEAHARRTRAETLRTRAELHSLRARLNPHFLFNTLHSLRVLVRRDPESAREAIDRLGELLRYVLDRESDSAAVALRREVQFVRAYLALEKIRFGDRLRVHAEVDPAALDAMVPSLLLQPLVENAVLHGIEPQASGGTVELCIALSGDDVVIRVSDDGVGADPLRERQGGLGLQTARQRLEMLYGEAARLEVDTRPGAGFRVRISLPAELPDEDAARPVRAEESLQP